MLEEGVSLEDGVSLEEGDSLVVASVVRPLVVKILELVSPQLTKLNKIIGKARVFNISIGFTFVFISFFIFFVYNNKSSTIFERSYFKCL